MYRFQGHAFLCDKIVVIVTLPGAIEGIPDKDYNFLGKDKFPNLYKRLHHERKLKSGYLERRIYERPLRSEPFIENQSEHISKLSLHQSLAKRIKVYSLRFLRRLNNKSSMLNKFPCKRISSILIPKSSAKNTRKTNSKRRNRIIFSPPDEISQRSERKMKVVLTSKEKQGNYFEINRFSTV